MDQEKLLTQQSPTNRGKSSIIQRGATILVLCASILPFLNNILKNFFDTESILYSGIPGAKVVDLDSLIFFFSMPVSYALIAIGGVFGAHKKSYYAIFASCYFQVLLVINFVFIKKERAYFLTQLFVAIIFIIVTVLFFLTQKYYRNIESVVEYLNKTLDRYSSIINKKQTKDEVGK